MPRFNCPQCQTQTDVEVSTSGHLLGSAPPLTVRFDCSGCGLTLNATTSGSHIWPDRPATPEGRA